jgi:hypothetical protein
LVLCVEDPALGCQAAIPTSSPELFVFSDGDVPIDPYGAGFATSDAIVLNSDWAPDPAYADAFAVGFWTQIPGTFTWVLPASAPSEPVGKWYFLPGGAWNVGTPSELVMLDPNGVTWSDFIQVDSTGPGGSAAIAFDSDPAQPVPEPATLLLFGTGLGFAAARRRLKQRR